MILLGIAFFIIIITIALKRRKKKTNFYKKGKKIPYPMKLCGKFSLIIVY